MSESSNGDILGSEIRKRLSSEPFYIQRLGIAAINMNYAAEFEFFLDQGLSPQQLYGAVIQELHRQNIPEPEKLLELFEVPDMYD